MSTPNYATCTCCHTSAPVPGETKCKTCRHIYRQAARSDTRKVSAMRQETIVLKGTFT